MPSSEGERFHKRHTDTDGKAHCAAVNIKPTPPSCLRRKLTFHKSCSLSDIVQQLVEDGSDCLFGQDEVLQRRDRSFCHGATATEVTDSDQRTRPAQPPPLLALSFREGNPKSPNAPPEPPRTPQAQLSLVPPPRQTPISAPRRTPRQRLRAPGAGLNRLGAAAPGTRDLPLLKRGSQPPHSSEVSAVPQPSEDRPAAALGRHGRPSPRRQPGEVPRPPSAAEETARTRGRRGAPRRASGRTAAALPASGHLRSPGSRRRYPATAAPLTGPSLPPPPPPGPPPPPPCRRRRRDGGGHHFRFCLCPGCACGRRCHLY